MSTTFRPPLLLEHTPVAKNKPTLYPRRKYPKPYTPRIFGVLQILRLLPFQNGTIMSNGAQGMNNLLLKWMPGRLQLVYLNA